MKGNICFFLLIGLSTTIFGQQETSDSLMITPEMRLASQKWLENLYSMGVETKGDTVVFNEEAKRILKDTNYQKILYPETYTWEVTQFLLKRMALKQAFWYMINMYEKEEKNKDLVLKMIVPFDQLFEADRVVVSTFYTYIAFDPEVATIENGKTTAINRPDIAEQKMLVAKEIVDHLLYYRSQQEEEGNSKN